MYLCICKQISEEMIDHKKGCDVQEEAKKLGMGSECGMCLLNLSQKGKRSCSRSPSQPRKKRK